MTIEELINRLSEFDPNDVVVLGGGEDIVAITRHHNLRLVSIDSEPAAEPSGEEAAQ